MASEEEELAFPKTATRPCGASEIFPRFVWKPEMLTFIAYVYLFVVFFSYGKSVSIKLTFFRESEESDKTMKKISAQNVVSEAFKKREYVFSPEIFGKNPRKKDSLLYNAAKACVGPAKAEVRVLAMKRWLSNSELFVGLIKLRNTSLNVPFSILH